MRRSPPPTAPSEVNATGTKLRPVTRVGKYTNVADLLAISSVFTDVVTRDQVPTTLPVLRDGRRKVISLEADTGFGTSLPTWAGGWTTSTPANPLATTR